jgi:tetratricopeptide (TPR) repeat protein
MRRWIGKWWIPAGLALLGFVGVSFTVWGLGQDGPAEISAGVRKALKNADWDRAEKLLDRLARRRPFTAADASLRAELELGRGHHDESVRILTSVPDSDPLAAKSRYVASQIENTRHRARGAEALLRDALRLDPSMAQARRDLIFLCSMQARRAEVNLQFAALAEHEPLTYDDVFLWTNSFENVWVNDTIRPHLVAYVAADPDDRLSRLALAAVFIHANELSEAEELLRSAPESDPEARVLKSRIALARMRLEEVRSLLDKGPSDHVGLALLRGQLAVRSNDPTTAASQFRLALELDPDNREALEGLTTAFKQLGKREEAAAAQKQADLWRAITRLLQKSKTLDDRYDKTALAELGKACEEVHQDPVARAWYLLALAADPLDPDLQRSLYRLRERSTRPARERSPRSSGVQRGRERVAGEACKSSLAAAW